MANLIYHMIGFFSAVSLALVLAFVLPGVLRGDFSIIRDFFETYRGIEPFVIFIFPVILVVGSAWIWRVISELKRR